MKGRMGAFELAVAMLLSGSIGVLVTMSGQPPENVVFFRCAIAFVCLLPYCALKGWIRRSFLTPKILLPVCISGIALVGNWVLLFKAYPLITIGLATTIYHVNPFIVLVGGAILLGQRVTLHDLIWTGIAFAGLTIAVASPGRFHVLNPNEQTGLALTLAASALYACTVLLAKTTPRVPAAFVVLVQTFVGALMVLPGVNFSILPSTHQGWGSLVVLGVVHTFFLYCLVFSAYQKLTVNSIAMLSFIYPLSAIAFDYLAYGHRLDAGQWTGVALILVSIVSVKIGWKPFSMLRIVVSKRNVAHQAKSASR